MRILVLVTDAFGGRGGIAKFNRDLLGALCAHTATDEVVAIPRLMPEPPGPLPAKLNYVTAGVGGKLRYSLAVLKSATSLAWNGAAERRPVLILCGHINLLPLAFLARTVCRAPLALVIHGIDAWQPTRSRSVNFLARRIDALIAVSEFTKRCFLNWAKPGAVKDFILPNAVDLAQFTPGPKNTALLDRYGLRERTVLMTVGRLSATERYKGIDEVMDVLPELAKQIPNLSYLIVGDGTDRARLEQKAARLGIRDRVVFAGHIDGIEKVDHYRLADAFVMPGRGEGFGIVYLEAMACGVPVVASKADASGEVVRDCASAIVVDPTCSDEIRAGIIKALRLQCGVAPEGVSYFSNQNFVRRCGEVLTALCATRR